MKPTDYTIMKVDMSQTNSMGQPVKKIMRGDNVLGYMDLMTGSDLSISQDSRFIESTNIFITFDIQANISEKDFLQDSSGKRYEVTLVDDVMEQGNHLEVYCKRVAQ